MRNEKNMLIFMSRSIKFIQNDEMNLACSLRKSLCFYWIICNEVRNIPLLINYTSLVSQMFTGGDDSLPTGDGRSFSFVAPRIQNLCTYYKECTLVTTQNHYSGTLPILRFNYVIRSLSSQLNY